MTPRGEQNPTPDDLRMQAIEGFEASLQGDYSHEGIVQSYDALESATFGAIGKNRGSLSIEDALSDLLARSEEARTTAASQDDAQTEALFVGKATSYKHQLEAIAPKTSAQPRKTDPNRRKMDSPKRK